jgi:hypothetical protein
MATETVIITGQGLDVAIEGPATPDRRPKRQRSTHVNTGQIGPNRDLGETIIAVGQGNPYWSDDANEWADNHPEVRPKDAAKEWRKHRIPPEEA